MKSMVVFFNIRLAAIFLNGLKDLNFIRNLLELKHLDSEFIMFM